MKINMLVTFATVLFCTALLPAQAELIGYWNFNNDTCNDTSGNDYHGTMNGGSYSTDVPAALAGGKSIDLTAGDHYVIIDSIEAGAPDDPFNFERSMTVSVWVKGWPDGNWEAFVSKRGETTTDDQAGWQVRRYNDTQQLSFTLRKEDLGVSTAVNLVGQTTSVTDGNWHHIAMTYNGYRQRIYVDGVLDRVYRTLGSIVPAAERVVFGAREYVERNPPVQFHSRVKLDDIAIYDNALTETQIKYIAQGGEPALVDQIVQPIAYWSFDDESINDHSGYNRHGTIYNGATYSTDVPSTLGGGKSLNLYGTNNYVLIDSVQFNDLADPFSLGQEITVSAWVKGWSKEVDWAPVLAAKHGENPWGWQVAAVLLTTHYAGQPEVSPMYNPI